MQYGQYQSILYAELQNNTIIIRGLVISEITDVVIPTNYNGLVVAQIQAYALSNEQNIQNIYLPETLFTVGQNAFLGTSNAIIHVDLDSIPIFWHSSWNPDQWPVILNSSNN